VRSAGFTLLSPGSHAAPTRSSVRAGGQRRLTSSSGMISASTPNARAMEAVRSSWVIRSGVRATVMLPQRLKPVACPVSRSRAA
jgi:hypothetical protein